MTSSWESELTWLTVPAKRRPTLVVVVAFAVALLDLTFAKLAPTPLDTPNRCTVRTRPRCPKRCILVLKQYLYVLLPRKRTKKLP